MSIPYANPEQPFQLLMDRPKMLFHLSQSHAIRASVRGNEMEKEEAIFLK
jgi:hypothetical protein